MKRTLQYIFAILALSALPMVAAQSVAWEATTGDTSLSAAATTATVQTTANVLVTLDKIVVYCSVACSVTQAANGTAATTTAGTIRAILPASPTSVLPLNFYTASNVGAGTAQGGAIHIPAGSSVVLCLSTTCGAAVNVTLGVQSGSTSNINYSVTIAAITGTANITFYGRVRS